VGSRDVAHRRAVFARESVSSTATSAVTLPRPRTSLGSSLLAPG
jgi:hypothetical protein